MLCYVTTTATGSCSLGCKSHPETVIGAPKSFTHFTHAVYQYLYINFSIFQVWTIKKSHGFPHCCWLQRRFLLAWQTAKSRKTPEKSQDVFCQQFIGWMGLHKKQKHAAPLVPFMHVDILCTTYVLVRST